MLSAFLVSAANLHPYTAANHSPAPDVHRCATHALAALVVSLTEDDDPDFAGGAGEREGRGPQPGVSLVDTV